MCGISGLIVGREPVDAKALGAAMVEKLRHRGPDASGVVALPEHQGVFAHTRLKVIDLSEAAAQPFTSTERDTFLVFNGEIYNFTSLRAELERDGASFVSNSDTEVILNQYLLRGVEGLRALDGMFALAIWDAQQRRLTLMRDRFGKKPVYWTIAPDGAFVFASEAKALFVHDAVPMEMDEGLLPEYLVYGYVGTPNSLFRGVSKLPPGSSLTYEPGGEPRIDRYWSLDGCVSDGHSISVGEAKAQVRQAIGRAVKRRMIADVPLGAFLSGGIDSSVVVAEMARQSSERVKTFAVGFDDDATFDETAHAREIANLFDTDHTEIRVRCSPVDLLEKLLYHHDEPYGDSSALAVHAVAEATKQHVTVVLTGDGGDEIFAGYTRFQAGLVTGKIPAAISRLVHRTLRHVPTLRGYKNPVTLMQRFVEHGERSADEQLLAFNSYFVGPRLENLLRRDVYGTDFDPWAVLGGQLDVLARERKIGRDRLGQILGHNAATYLLDDLLVKVDRMTMAVALEARSPFLDTELAELLFRMPSSIKLRYGKLKWLLREAYRDVLPSSVLDRKKHGFGVPISRWWGGEASALVDDLLLAPRARIADYLDASAIRSCVKAHRSGRFDHGQRIFALLQLELWLRSLAARRVS